AERGRRRGDGVGRVHDRAAVRARAVVGEAGVLVVGDGALPTPARARRLCRPAGTDLARFAGSREHFVGAGRCVRSYGPYGFFNSASAAFNPLATVAASPSPQKCMK